MGPDIDLTVPGEPKGKGRPRFKRATGAVYTPTATMRAEQRIQVEWIAAGRPTVDGPLRLAVTLVMGRPQTHLKKDGSLSAAGHRLPRPTKKPDWDNVGKLVADSLNSLAYRDDCQIVLAQLEKRWAVGDEQEHTRIRIWELGE
jgi:Holliday junction resolvase RusA-like endonuclease